MREGLISEGLLCYSIFGIAVIRKHTLKWLFLNKKPPFTAVKKSTCIPKML